MRKLLAPIFVALLFFCCQKDFNLDDGLTPPPTTPSVFTTVGSPNACTNFVLEGVYSAGFTLDSTNKVTVKVNVTKAGTFDIKTNPVNGYYFSAKGTFANTGTQSVVLKGSGIPVSAGNDQFTLNGCSFTVAVVAPSPSAFTLVGAPNACTSAIVNGVYISGIALTATNTVALQVDVTAIGSYTISTNTVSGITFSKTGVFASKGIQTVVLSGSGTPTVSGTLNITPQAGTSSCSFPVTVLGAASFTLAGAPGNCSSATVNGNYSVGTALNSTNTVSLSVNVTTPGSYAVSTNTVGGITFSGTGFFTTTGTQNIVLTGSGTPTVSGANVITPQVGTSSCSFSVNVVGPAVYTLAGAPSACTSATVNGTYLSGTALNSTNTVSIGVNVTTPGSYTLTTNTVSGIAFSKSGIFTTTGAQTVTLAGSGTPTASGNITLTPQVGSSSCTFTVNVVGPAVYTFPGAPGACAVATVNGTYTAGTALTSINTVTTQVNVTSVGPYTISTNTIGGINFSKSGTFTTTGIQTVVLNGSGTPNSAGTKTFTVGTNGCTFDIPITAPTGTFQCKVDGVLITFNDRAEAEVLDNFYSPPTPYLHLDGYTGPPNGGSVPEFQIFVIKNDNSVVGTGTYNVDGFLLPVGGYQIEIDYHVVNPDLSVTIWNTSSSILSTNPPFTVTVTNRTATRVQGTFSGTLKNTAQGGNLTKTITEGVFDLPIL